MLRSLSSRLGFSGFLSLCVCLGAALPRDVRADSFSSYEYAGSFELPPGASVFDALGDGRVMAAGGATIWVETGVASGLFTSTGTLAAADFPSFGAAFVRVSPDGTKFAVGNNGGASFGNYQIGVFGVTTLAGTWFTANHYDAAWIDNRFLAVTAGDFVNPSLVTVLDTQSPIPASPVNVTVVQNIGGASGGVALDTAGRLYTGNGFAGAGPSGTGAVKAFSFASWSAAFLGGPALNFETSGTLVVDVLSASPLVTDAEDNLFVGGGSFSESGQSNYAALVRNTAVAAALLGGPPANSGDPQQTRRLDPDTANGSNFYAVQVNGPLHRAYVHDGSGSTVHTYQDAHGIPTVSQWGLVSATLGLLILGTCLIRFRGAIPSAANPGRCVHG